MRNNLWNVISDLKKTKTILLVNIILLCIKVKERYKNSHYILSIYIIWKKKIKKKKKKKIINNMLNLYI